MVLPVGVFQEELDKIRAEGLYKEERVITSPQGVEIRTGRPVPSSTSAPTTTWGSPTIRRLWRRRRASSWTTASAWPPCGSSAGRRTFTRNWRRRSPISSGSTTRSSTHPAGTPIRASSETILGPEDAVISDALNHASIIDGIRLCKAARLRYAHGDMDELESRLKEAAGCRIRLIATDGVFSMDGDMARLDRIAELARKHDALVMLDDSHATGIVGPSGRGTAEQFGLAGRIDIITSTLGKAMGGASGGFTAGRGPIVDLLRQRSRPYLFFQHAGAGHRWRGDPGVPDRLRGPRPPREAHGEHALFPRGDYAGRVRDQAGEHPIVPVMLYEATLAQQMAAELLKEGIYAIGFFYPVVPKGEARVRVQISAAHEKAHLDEALSAFARVGRRLGVIR